MLPYENWEFQFIERYYKEGEKANTNERRLSYYIKPINSSNPKYIYIDCLQIHKQDTTQKKPEQKA